MEKGIKLLEEPKRKRGRPAGKNRVPLSEEERRGRNSQYERERRRDYADAIADLKDAMGCHDPKISNNKLLENVWKFLEKSRQMDPSDDLETLRSVNKNLMEQIQSCEKRLQSSNPALPGLKLEFVNEDKKDNNNTANMVNFQASSSYQVDVPAPQATESELPNLTIQDIEELLPAVIKSEAETSPGSSTSQESSTSPEPSITLDNMMDFYANGLPPGIDDPTLYQPEPEWSEDAMEVGNYVDEMLNCCT